MDSNILRWLLLIVAAVVLFVWYMVHLFSNHRRGRPTKHTHRKHLDEEPNDIPDQLMSENDETPQKPAEAIPSADDLMILAVDCKNDKGFKGSEVIELLIARGLEEGKYSIYHRNIQSDGSKRLVYSVINGVEPGYMNEDFAQSETPSIMFFLDLEHSYNPLKAFSEMLEAAQSLASQLSGSVCDSDHNPLTEQTTSYLRETIREKERSKHLQTNH